VSGSKRDLEAWDLQFGFAFSENATGITIGEITDIDKKGWHYLWVYYELFDDTDNHAIVKVPANVFIEKLYLPGDFTGLGLP
jgi:hypothetical protein